VVGVPHRLARRPDPNHELVVDFVVDLEDDVIEIADLGRPFRPLQ